MVINRSLSKLLFPSLVGIVVYLVVNKYFPDEIETKNDEKDPKNSLVDIRGRNEHIKSGLLKQLIERVMKDKAIKLGLVGVFGTAAWQNYGAAIEKVLLDSNFYNLATRDADGSLKIVCDKIEEYSLASSAESVRSLILEKKLTRGEKVKLLQVKFDSIINCEYVESREFLILLFFRTIVTLTLSGIGGLTLILEALYKLWQKGKISEKLYRQLIKLVSKKSTVTPLT